MILVFQIQTEWGKTWKLLLESYHLQTRSSFDTVSITDSGYEMLNEQTIPLHSILVPQQDNSSFQLEQIRCQVSCER